MNFLEGRVADGWFSPAAQDANATGCGLKVGLQVPQGEVTLGVRPEDLMLTGQSAPLLEGTVDVIEHIGHETMMYIDFHGQQLVARLGPDVQHSPGDRLPLFVRPGCSCDQAGNICSRPTASSGGWAERKQPRSTCHGSLAGSARDHAWNGLSLFRPPRPLRGIRSFPAEAQRARSGRPRHARKIHKLGECLLL
jgi:hypothetical protein